MAGFRDCSAEQTFSESLPFPGGINGRSGEEWIPAAELIAGMALVEGEVATEFSRNECDRLGEDATADAYSRNHNSRPIAKPWDKFNGKGRIREWLQSGCGWGLQEDW